MHTNAVGLYNTRAQQQAFHVPWPAGISCRDRDGIHAFPSAPSKIVIRGFSGSGSALSYVIRGFSGSRSVLSLSKDNSIVPLVLTSCLAQGSH